MIALETLGVNFAVSNVFEASERAPGAVAEWRFKEPYFFYVTTSFINRLKWLHQEQVSRDQALISTSYSWSI